MLFREIVDERADLVEILLEIWRNSVTASHNFLTADDIENLAPIVEIKIQHAENLVVAYEDDFAVGFMCITARKIEMLFVAPEYFRQGFGSRFIEIAVDNYSAKFADCNEQNIDALKFFESMGFEIFGRDEIDVHGKLFPILKLKNKFIDNLLKTEICGMKMSTPILAASGTFGFGEEFADFVDIDRLGGVMVKCITLAPRSGNVGVRIAETPAGMLNSIGLENPGIDKFLNDILPRIKNYTTNIIVNISGSSVEDYGELAKLLDVDGVAAIELNISCPNVKDGGIIFGTDPKAAAAVTEAAKKNTGKPVIVKLSPNVTDITEIARAVESAGADCLSLINTLMGMQININTWRPTLGNITGGLSGGAIKPVAVRMVWQTAQVVNIPIIGMGGIRSAEDAVEFLLAGASAVAVGTANFADPNVTMKIADGLEIYLQARGLENVNEIVGGVVIGN